VVVLPADTNGPFLPSANGTSEQTHRLIDTEVRRIVEAAHAEASELLGSERDRLDALAQALIEHETLDEVDAYGAAGIPHGVDEDSDVSREPETVQLQGGRP
jgi:cell division protease FtsH